MFMDVDDMQEAHPASKENRDGGRSREPRHLSLRFFEGMPARFTGFMWTF